MEEIPRWSVWEVEMTGEVQHGRLPEAVGGTVELVSPGGAEHRVEAFWDGGRSWRARFAPGEVGDWTWRSRSDADAALDGASGQFRCVEASEDQPLHRGPLRVSDDRRHLAHGDGTPFFWLGDTAWNGALRANENDWAEYLSLRREQGFNVIQFVTTQWRGRPGAGVYDDTDGLTVNVEAFQRLDRMVAAVNEHGMVAAPVMLWTLTERDPGQTLSEEHAIALCRYMVARWGAYNVAWLLGGDGRFPEESIERWRWIGRAVFGADHDRPVTMHPCGSRWVEEEFASEPWFDFIGYQSGHGLPEKTSRWIAKGPPARAWRTLEMPIINLEPNYEGFPAYGSEHIISAHDVRRAAWLSILSTPPAGVTYGTNPIWVWHEETGPAPGHSNLTSVQPWREGLESEGIEGMTALREIIDDLEWWRLRPAQELLANQPGSDDPRDTIVAVMTEERDLLVAYTPSGKEIALTEEDLPAQAMWRDPRDGSSRQADITDGTFSAPDESDWLLILRR